MATLVNYTYDGLTDQMRDWVLVKKKVLALRASVWSKYKWELPPQAPPFDPPLPYDHEVNH